MFNKKFLSLLTLALFLVMNSAPIFAKNKKKSSAGVSSEQMDQIIADAWKKGMNGYFEALVQLSKKAQNPKGFYSSLTGIDEKDPVFKDIDPEVTIPKITKIQDGVEVEAEGKKPYSIRLSTQVGKVEIKDIKKSVRHILNFNSSNGLFALILFSAKADFAQASAVDFFARLGNRVASTVGRQIFNIQYADEAGMSGRVVLGTTAAFTGGMAAMATGIGCVYYARERNQATTSVLDACKEGAEEGATNGSAFGAGVSVGTGAVAAAIYGSPLGKLIRLGLVGGPSAALGYVIGNPINLVGNQIADLIGSRLQCSGRDSFRVQNLSLHSTPQEIYNVSGDNVYLNLPSGRVTVRNTLDGWTQLLKNDPRNSGIPEGTLRTLAGNVRSDIVSKQQKCRNNPSLSESYMLGPNTAQTIPQQGAQPGPGRR
jgi:hypothetical protein